MENFLKTSDTKQRYQRFKENFRLRQVATLQNKKLPKRTLLRQDKACTTKAASSQRSTPIIVTYPVKGENIVNNIWYMEPNSIVAKGIVWINKLQYFENVPPNVWSYGVGNYLVCQKWLKAREGSVLDCGSIRDFQRLVMLIGETIDLIDNVDSQLK